MDSKRCCTCKQMKPLDEFNRLSRAKDGRQPSCRECNRAWPAANGTRHNSGIHERNKRLRPEKRRLMFEYLASHPCVDCGESDPLVLEFDHVRGVKRLNVTDLLSRDYPWSSVLKEIEKCEVVCANCHRRRTYGRRPTYRSLRSTSPPGA